jgi:alanine racemase
VESIDLSGIRATRALIDLDAIAGNVRAVRSVLPSTTQIMAVVKADAYGHGATWVARTALQAGASCLGVATVSEGRALRSAGLREPIILVGSIDPAEAPEACRIGLEITVAHETLLGAVQRYAQGNTESPVKVHIKIDTGLRRNGALPHEAQELAARIVGDGSLSLASIYTHFASADEPDESFTEEQLDCFSRTVAAMREVGVRAPMRHVANSAAILTGRGTDLELVRLGISLYGLPPSDAVPLLPGMRPALSITSRVARVVQLAAGDTVGYNRTYRASKSSGGALVPIGYADGYRRSLSSRGWVGLQGQPAPVLGRVSMDQIVVGIPELAAVAIGDPVAIISRNGADGAPSTTEIAELMGTNVYEVLVGIRQRVPRVYLREGRIIGARVAGVDFAITSDLD